MEKKDKKCKCGKIIWHSSKTCLECRNQNGEKNNRWKGGRAFTKWGILIHQPNHPFRTKDGYIYEHRLMMEKRLGRYLKPEEVIHHLDYNNVNNDDSNLALFSCSGEHRKYHNMLRRVVKQEVIYNGL